MNEEKCDLKSRSFPFPNGHQVWNLAIQSDRGSGKWRAGTGILVSRSLAHMVVKQGTIMDGRAQFISIKSNNGFVLSIINIYIPIVSMGRASLWNKIVEANVEGQGFILARDFNMVEDPKDTLGGSKLGSSSNRREKVA